MTPFDPEEILLLFTAMVLVTCLVFRYTLKMEAIRASETSVNFNRTAKNHDPKDGTLSNN
jgi:hypothetical protein